MFFKTLYLALAMIILILGAVLIEAVLRERAYTRRLLLGTAGIYALGGLTALLCSLANL
ncbi:MAG: hypothetical protein PHP28_13555 [Actinomycetota bacterium]|nr:hypothetical protein [Actinomycetota bacterium]MDD5667860.1 hypothetical protein [Actinomycetota bacterium]